MLFKTVGTERAALCALLSIWFCVIISFEYNGNDGICPASAQDHGPVMIVDPGHGGMDGGAVSVTGKKESEINWHIAERLYDLSGFLGIDAVMTRNTYAIDYPEGYATVTARKKWDTRKRTELINSVDNGVLISIHQNYYPSSGPGGAQVLYNAVSGGRVLAEMIRDRFSRFGDFGNRNISAADSGIYIMSHSVRPGVLVECGFLSNPHEAGLLESEEHQIRLAVCIAAAFYDFTGDEMI